MSHSKAIMPATIGAILAASLLWGQCAAAQAAPLPPTTGFVLPQPGGSAILMDATGMDALLERGAHLAMCESTWNPLAVSLAGARGLWQIMPLHRPRMARLGLDYDSERDRQQYGVHLMLAGEYPWECER